MPLEKSVEAYSASQAYWNEDELILVEKEECKEGECNMDKILKLYIDRKTFEINNDYNIEKEKIIEEDEIKQIQKEFENQINTILKNEGQECELELSGDNIYTKATQEKLSKLEISCDKKKDELYANISEIEALLELAPNYEQKTEILRAYGILDKKGKMVK